MGYECTEIMLYSSQAEIVLETLKRDVIFFSIKEYLNKKYEESAPIFTAAYDWFVKEATRHLPKPEGAEYPYWAFGDPYSVDQSAGNRIVTLHLPADQAVYFDMYDWNKILCLKYLGETEEDERAFGRMLSDYGIRKESDVILTGFYPDLKYQVMESWKRLFRHHEDVLSGNRKEVRSVQAGLWCLKKEWL